MADSKKSQERAESQFSKALHKKAQEAKQAMSQYEADARAVGEKTAKLKALRLAKEEADAKAAAETKKIRRTRSPSPKKAETSS
jgi:hypothetical protein